MTKIISFNKKPKIIAASSVVGQQEANGPLSEYFDICRADTKFGMPTWEQAESEMVRIAFETALIKSRLRDDQIDIVFAGDLINQCTSTSFGLADKQVPFLGIYGACSTFAEGMILSAGAIEAGMAANAACATSSHFCTAERQYRFPIEYGCQRTPTAQYTVTGSACAIIGDSPVVSSEVYINEALIGKISDFGITDANNMGAAMAPAAADTLTLYLKEGKIEPNSFDLILTGDLGLEGRDLFRELMAAHNYPLGSNYNDCGCLIYDTDKQDVDSGGSGCGCLAVTLSSYILKLFSDNKIKDILFLGTGALLSPTTTMQKLSIPGVAHLVRLTKD